jgi:hypothetical protein
MIELTLSKGKYSDFTVHFNSTQFNLHLDLLADNLEYFNIIRKGNFKETNTSNITFDDFNGNRLNADYFRSLMNIIYHDSINYNICATVKNIVSATEFYRMCDFLGYRKLESIKRIISNILHNIKPYTEKFDDLHINKCSTYSRYLYKIKGNCYNCKIFFDSTNKSNNNDLTRIPLYDTINEFTCTYAEFLINIFDNDNDQIAKIIGICNFEIQDIHKFDIKYYKQLCLIYALRK